MEEMRLQKFLAEAGVASRRKAEEIIQQGRVKVNGAPVSGMGTKVVPGDIVEVDGKRVQTEEKKVYIMLNKPVGYVSTAKDQFSRATVLDLVQGVKERVFPVGRLDYDTSGLLLLTNDGEFTYRMTHPKHEVEKVYLAVVQGCPHHSKLKEFEAGIEIDGYRTAPAGIKILEKKYHTSILEITIHEGKNRQVRKMCEAIGHPVLRLKRIAIGELKLGDLQEGQWRSLANREMEWIKEYFQS